MAIPVLAILKGILTYGPTAYDVGNKVIGWFKNNKGKNEIPLDETNLKSYNEEITELHHRIDKINEAGIEQTKMINSLSENITNLALIIKMQEKKINILLSLGTVLFILVIILLFR